MLDRGDTPRLHALDVGHGHAGGQKGVLAEVLEVAAAHGRAVDVDARPQRSGRRARGRPGPCSPPRAGQAGSRSPPARCRPPGGGRAALRTPIGPSDIFRRGSPAAARRECRRVHAAEQVDLLFQRHLARMSGKPAFRCRGKRRSAARRTRLHKRRTSTWTTRLKSWLHLLYSSAPKPQHNTLPRWPAGRLA